MERGTPTPLRDTRRGWLPGEKHEPLLGDSDYFRDWPSGLRPGSHPAGLPRGRPGRLGRLRAGFLPPAAPPRIPGGVITSASFPLLSPWGAGRVERGRDLSATKDTNNMFSRRGYRRRRI